MALFGKKKRSNIFLLTVRNYKQSISHEHYYYIINHNILRRFGYSCYLWNIWSWECSSPDLRRLINWEIRHCIRDIAREPGAIWHKPEAEEGMCYLWFRCNFSSSCIWQICARFTCKRQIYLLKMAYLEARAGGFLEQWHWTDTLNTGGHVAREHIWERVFVLFLLSKIIKSDVKVMTDHHSAPAESSARSLHGFHEQLFHVRLLQLTERSMRSDHNQGCSWHIKENSEKQFSHNKRYFACI